MCFGVSVTAPHTGPAVMSACASGMHFGRLSLRSYSTARSPVQMEEVGETDGPVVLAGYGYGLPISRLCECSLMASTFAFVI